MRSNQWSTEPSQVFCKTLIYIFFRQKSQMQLCLLLSLYSEYFSVKIFFSFCGFWLYFWNTDSLIQCMIGTKQITQGSGLHITYACAFSENSSFVAWCDPFIIALGFMFGMRSLWTLWQSVWSCTVLYASGKVGWEGVE